MKQDEKLKQRLINVTTENNSKTIYLALANNDTF